MNSTSVRIFSRYDSIISSNSEPSIHRRRLKNCFGLIVCLEIRSIRTSLSVI